MSSSDRFDSPTPSAATSTYLIVAVVALTVHGLALAAAQCWVYPDSIDYIQLAGGIADRADFTNELYLVRTPGYPLFLAWVFLFFGSNSPTAILLFQHAMVVATALVTTAIAWRLTQRKAFAIASGCLCACSLQLLAYANMVLTETPYTFVLAAVIYALVRFTGDARWRWLALASSLAGVAYLLRPIALNLLPICGFLALRQVWLTRHAHSPWRLGPLGAAAAFLPAFLIAVPWMAVSAVSHGSLQATRCLDYVYYIRPATFDGFDSAKSEAVRDIHGVIAEAQRMGRLGPSADYRDRATVIKAYQAVRGLSFAESSEILGQAGRDLMREHPWAIFVGTFRYAAWMLLSPDPVYRFQPGGSPGHEGRRDGDAEILDVATYGFGAGSWEPTLREVRHYLPLESSPKAATAYATAVARWFHRNIEKGRPILGLADSLYEEFMLLVAVGAAISLLQASRAAWLTIGCVLSLHILVSAFFGAAQTRYVAPVRPILCLYLPLLPFLLLRVAERLAGSIRDCGTRWARHPENPIRAPGS